MKRLAPASLLLAISAAAFPSAALRASAEPPVEPPAQPAEPASPLQPVLDAYKNIKTYQSESVFFINARGRDDLGTLMLNSWSTRFDRASACIDVKCPGVFHFSQNKDAALLTLQCLESHVLQRSRIEPLMYAPLRSLLHKVQKGTELEVPLVAIDVMFLLDGKPEALAPDAKVTALAPESDATKDLRSAAAAAQTEGANADPEGEFEAYHIQAKAGTLNLLIDAKTHLVVAAALDVDSSWLELPPGTPLRLIQVCSDVAVDVPVDAAQFSIPTEGLTKVESDDEFAKLVPKMEVMEESDDE